MTNDADDSVDGGCTTTRMMMRMIMMMMTLAEVYKIDPHTSVWVPGKCRIHIHIHIHPLRKSDSRPSVSEVEGPRETNRVAQLDKASYGCTLMNVN